ncbi:unnamed protein product [Rhodiola kirilowii]
MKHFQLSTLLLIIIGQPIFPWCKTLASAQVLHHGCLEKCGDVEIPYPFGTNEGCYFNSDFFMRIANKMLLVLLLVISRKF